MKAFGGRSTAAVMHLIVDSWGEICEGGSDLGDVLKTFTTKDTQVHEVSARG